MGQQGSKQYDIKERNYASKKFYKGNEKFKAGDYEGARIQYMKAFSSLKNTPSPEQDSLRDHGHQDIALSNLGCLEFAEGRYYAQITHVCSQTCLYSKWQLYIHMNDLHTSFNNRYEEAKKLFEQTILARRTAASSVESVVAEYDEKREEKRDVDSDIVSLQSLVLSLEKDNLVHYDASQERAKVALQDHYKADSILGDACNNLAACYEVTGNLAEAKKFYQESLQLRKLIYGPRGAKVAESYQNLATVLDYEGNLIEADELYHQALSVFRELYGENCRQVAVTLNNLGLLYNSMVNSTVQAIFCSLS